MAFPKLNMFVVLVHVAGVRRDHLLASSSRAARPRRAGRATRSCSIARWATPGSLNGQTFWLIALLFVGISSLMGSVNYITTIINCAPRA